MSGVRTLGLIALGALLSALFGMCGCTRSTETRSDSSSTARVVAQRAEEQHQTRRVEEGPETITTTVEEYALPSAVATAIASAEGASDGHSVATGLPVTSRPPTLPQRAALIKRTVTVDQRGPVVATSTIDAHAASQTQATVATEARVQSASKTRWGPPWWLWLLGAGALAATGYALWKLQPPWLKALRAWL